MTRIFVSLNALMFVLLVPLLEVSDTHLFNAEWPPHARLHEAWQLATNMALSLLALVLVWKSNRPVAAVVACLAICLPFVAVWLLQGVYGGSMQRSDGAELAAFGVNIAALSVLVVSAGLLASVAIEIPAFRKGNRA